MAKFSKHIDAKSVAKKQAANIMKQLQHRHLPSVGTVRNYEERLTQVAKYANSVFHCGLRALTVEQAHQYLTDRAAQVGQSTLDMERQAIQAMMHHVTMQLPVSQGLCVIQSEKQQLASSRAYTYEQIQLIAAAQNDKNALATYISYYSGIRAHELYTLRPIDERTPDDRPALPEKFKGRRGKLYTVHGKGGLVRVVLLPKKLAKRLEARRLTTPINIVDRGINYQSYYDINGGNRWSSSFSAASKRTLNWSAGAHGMRHTYAQERMAELQQMMPFDKALAVVSQEIGHFRPEITLIYLR
ncbi:site-specific integrase [Vibrio alfacsensis]|uniref:site-specific integrase n=1 Tax=Vibrio TaxID=662 RepID=UPI0040689C9E